MLYKLVKSDIICPLTEGEMIYVLALCVTRASVRFSTAVGIILFANILGNGQC